jgi:hypothetical protein
MTAASSAKGLLAIMAQVSLRIRTEQVSLDKTTLAARGLGGW